MNQQDVCVLLGLNRAKQDIRRAARQLASTEEVVHRWGQSLKPVDAKWVKATLDWQQQPNQGLVGWFDEDYPVALREIAEPPLLLFYRGRRELLARPKVALVGSRKATHSGLQMAHWLADASVNAGITVVSGLAMGIDAQAHRTAVEAAATIAVLGTGIDKSYPARNRELQQLIAHQGLLLSEFPPGISARMDHFPRRNRIISGLSKAVVVVEAAKRSGSISTALQAINENREVGAVPGSPFSASSAGCHWLIKQGATLVAEPNDVLVWFNAHAKTSQRAKTNDEQESLANSDLFANVNSEPVSVDELVQQTGLSAAEVTEQLLHMELAGLVVAVAGGYIKVGRR